MEVVAESGFLPLAKIKIRKTTTATNRKALKITRSVHRGQLQSTYVETSDVRQAFVPLRTRLTSASRGLFRGCLRHHQYLNSYFMTIFNMYSRILNIVNYCLSESLFNSGYGIISEPKLKLKKYGFKLG